VALLVVNSFQPAEVSDALWHRNLSPLPEGASHQVSEEVSYRRHVAAAKKTERESAQMNEVQYVRVCFVLEATTA
jgi:hypothetical protein